MPELPEVETIARDLSKILAGREITGIFVFDRKIKLPRIKFPVKIGAVSRHGKYVVLSASNGEKCLLHLRMTGELLFEGKRIENRQRKHQKAVFVFKDGSALRFVDVRRFGTIEWLKRETELPRLGVDPFSGSFSPEKLAKLFKKSSRTIKSFLLDQQKISGLGNIYADESLWLSGINPTKRSSSLKNREIEALALAIGKVLREALKKRGSTLRDYRRPDGSSGGYQRVKKVYGREDEPCLRCGVKIKRIKVGGRSSYYCPSCQRNPRGKS